MASPITTAAASLEGQVLETAMALQALEVDQSDADTLLDNVQVTFDTDAETASITVTLPVGIALTSGAPSFTATPYVTD